MYVVIDVDNLVVAGVGDQWAAGVDLNMDDLGGVELSVADVENGGIVAG